MLVVKPDSSMKTRLAMSRAGCSSCQPSRAALTSGLFCSDACRVFFEAPADMAEIAVKPGPAGFDPPLAQVLDQFIQGGVRCGLHKRAHQLIMGGKLILAVAAHALGHKAACRLGMLHQFDHGAGGHI